MLSCTALSHPLLLGPVLLYVFVCSFPHLTLALLLLFAVLLLLLSQRSTVAAAPAGNAPTACPASKQAIVPHSATVCHPAAPVLIVLQWQQHLLELLQWPVLQTSQRLLVTQLLFCHPAAPLLIVLQWWQHLLEMLHWPVLQTSKRLFFTQLLFCHPAAPLLLCILQWRQHLLEMLEWPFLQASKRLFVTKLRHKNKEVQLPTRLYCNPQRPLPNPSCSSNWQRHML
jgi:hypothetical protein